MVIKKISVFIIAVLIALSSVFSVLAEDNTVLNLGRVYVYMPEITVELKGSGYNAKDITAALGTEALKVSSAEKFDPSKNPVCTYIIIDQSGSMKNSIAGVKNCVTAYVNLMGDDDRLILITFGESVKTVLSGEESKEEILGAVSKLHANEDGTLFYEALNKAYEMSNANQSSFEREYVMVFSDGMDYQKGSSTFNESMNLYSTRTLPLYAACASNASQEAADKFGEIARASGGSLVMMRGKINDVFSSFVSSINNVTLLKLKAKSNIATGDLRQLSIKAGDLQADINVPVIRSVPDNIQPEADRVTFDPDNNTLAVHFTKNVLNADKPSAFDITEEKGAKLVIGEVKYFDDQQIAYLTLQDAYVGNYTVIFNGVTDNSKEANKLVKSAYFKLDESLGITKTVPSDLPVLWIVVIACALLAVAAITVMLIVITQRKKTSGEAEGSQEVPLRADKKRIQNEYDAGEIIDVKHHIKAASAIHASLIVKTGKNAEQKITVDIVSSLIVGRSDTCDLYVDDTKMSRQHFVIENDSGALFIMDLGATNGTMLNGIKIGSRQRLSSGDKIFAGLSDIIILFA